MKRWVLPALGGVVLGGAVAVSSITAHADQAAKDCAMTAIDRTACAYEAILADIRESYPMEAGGGITALRQTATTTYVATIGREEVSDIWTYDLEFAEDGTVSIVNRSERTE